MPKEEVERLKELYQKEIVPSVRDKIADVMSGYGDEAIPYLIECADGEIVPSNREHSLGKIMEIKGSTH